MDKLKPCPFCGGKARIVNHGYHVEWFTVECLNCGIEIPDRFYECQSDAVEAWNRRAGDVKDGDCVPVVRCKDCAVPHNEYIGCAKVFGRNVKPNWYCADGERKDGDSDEVD